jgi:hypothetical protein
MSTNATTWFYREPEKGRPYLISERLTHTFWANRLSAIYLSCVKADSPYKVVGQWHDTEVEMEWVPNQWFRLTSDKDSAELIMVCRYVLGFRPSLSYYNPQNKYVAEWYTDQTTGKARINELQGNPAYQAISTKYSK